MTDPLKPYPPAAPQTIKATATASSVTVVWSDDSVREDGYKVQRSSDGATFSDLVKLPANSTTYIDSAVVAGGTYYYKVCAFNGYGDSKYTGVAKVVIPAAPTPVPVSGFKYKGLGSSLNLDFAFATGIYKECGTNLIRTWGNIDFASRLPYSAANYDYIKRLAGAGVKTISLLTPSGGVHPVSYSVAKAYFTKLLNASAYHPYAYEIFNEIDLTQYFTGTFAQYVEMLRAASDVFRPHGIKLVGSALGVSNLANYEKLIGLGYLDLIDYANCHPYFGDASGQINFVKQLKAAVGSKEIILTEWGFHRAKSGTAWDTSWANQIQPALTGMKPYVAGVCYFQYKRLDTMAGPESILQEDAKTHNEPFYTAYRNAK